MMVNNKLAIDRLQQGNKKLKILLADDHPLFRQALRGVIEKNEEFEVIGEAGTGNEAVELAKKLIPDLVIMDISMPDLDGAGATIKIKLNNPMVAVLALTVHADNEHIMDMLNAGAAGYLTKNVGGEEVIRAIRAIAFGEAILSPDVFRQIVKKATWSSKYNSGSLIRGLTDRESQIIRLVAKGKCNKDIAKDLNINIRTVKGHLVNIFSKFRVSSRTELISLGLRDGFLTTRDME